MAGDGIVLCFALLTLLLAVGAGIVLAVGNRKILFLRNLPLPAGPLPTLSVVVAARNEEADIERALSTLRDQDYPGLEVVVVDDRSEDSTGAILDRMAAADSRIRVLHLNELPAGWLGKNHALQRGAEAASGEFLLFTDADVRFAPSCLSRAGGFAVERGLDFLSVSPLIEADGIILRAFMGVFTFFFALMFLPWRARIPGSKRFVGIGAFNMVRRSFYFRHGGHEPIRLRPDDDLQLGRFSKLRGARQDLLFGCGALAVRWYPSVGAMVRGLEKNAFTVYNYSFARAVLSVPLVVALNVAPFVGALLPIGPARWLFLAAALCIVVACADGARFHGLARWCGFFYPAIIAFFGFIVLRAVLLTALRGGILWRGTFYSLESLRANRVE
jgi:glycosyltransferase involved in cell wall biosynthesis